MFGGAAAAFAYWFFIDAHHPKVQHEATYLLNINVSTKRVLFKCWYQILMLWNLIVD